MRFQWRVEERKRKRAREALITPIVSCEHLEWGLTLGAARQQDGDYYCPVSTSEICHPNRETQRHVRERERERDFEANR